MSGRRQVGDTITHNASSYANYGCRCEVCLVAHRERAHSLRQTRYAARRMEAGRLVAPLPTGRHGLNASYVNHGCRCERCTAAHSAACSKRRAA